MNESPVLPDFIRDEREVSDLDETTIFRENKRMSGKELKGRKYLLSREGFARMGNLNLFTVLTS